MVPLETELQRHVTTEMTQRSFAFAFCALAIHSYLSDSPMPSFAASHQLHLPCPRSLWNGLEHDPIPHTEENTAVAVYEKLFRHEDEVDETNPRRNHVSQLASEGVWVLLGLHLQRLKFTREAAHLQPFESVARSEDERLE